MACALAGCDVDNWMKVFTPPAEEKIARQFVEDVRARNFGPVEEKLDPSLKSANVQATFRQMAGAFPAESPKSVKVVGSNAGTFAGGASSYNITFEYEFPHAWVLANAAFIREKGAVRIVGLNVYCMQDSLEKMNAFTVRGKGSLFLVFLATTIGVTLFTIGTAIVCARTPIPRRKWLWVIFTLVGFGALQLNWTTGEIGYLIVNVSLFGASYMQNFYSPAVLSVRASCIQVSPYPGALK